MADVSRSAYLGDGDRLLLHDFVDGHLVEERKGGREEGREGGREGGRVE